MKNERIITFLGFRFLILKNKELDIQINLLSPLQMYSSIIHL